MNALDFLDKLIHEDKIEIREGVFLSIDGEVNISIYPYKDITVINFGTPQPKVEIKQIGLLNMILKPSINKIQISKDDIKILLDRFKDITIDRAELEKIMNGKE